MNIEIRNLIGGFLGGFAGIVLFHFLGFWYMPLGCFFGSVGGYWHREVLQYAFSPSDTNRQAWKKITDFVKADWSRTCSDCRVIMLHINKQAESGKSFFVRLRFRMTLMTFKTPGVIPGCFTWIFWLPLRFCKWVKEHPYNRSWVTSILVTTSTYVAIVFSVRSILDNYMGTSASAGEVYEVMLLYYIFSAFPIMYGVMYHKGFHEDDRDPNWSRYESWSQSPILFAARASFVTAYGMVLIGLGLVLLMYVTIGCMFLFLASIFFWTIAKVMFRIAYRITELSTQRAHMACMVVTMVTTCVTAFCLRGQINDLGVWVVSFANGILCGLLSVATYRLAKWITVTNEKLIMLAYEDMLMDDLIEFGIAKTFKSIYRVAIKPSARFALTPLGIRI